MDFRIKLMFVLLGGLILSGCSFAGMLSTDMEDVRQFFQRIQRSSIEGRTEQYAVYKNIQSEIEKQHSGCEIVIEDVNLLEKNTRDVVEEWSVSYCGQKEVYFVSVELFKPFSYYIGVVPREKRIEKEVWLRKLILSNDYDPEQIRFYYVDSETGELK